MARGRYKHLFACRQVGKSRIAAGSTPNTLNSKPKREGTKPNHCSGLRVSREARKRLRRLHHEKADPVSCATTPHGIILFMGLGFIGFCRLEALVIEKGALCRVHRHSKPLAFTHLFGRSSASKQALAMFAQLSCRTMTMIRRPQ